MKLTRDGYQVFVFDRKNIEALLELLPPNSVRDTKFQAPVYVLGLPGDIEKFKKLIEKV